MSKGTSLILVLLSIAIFFSFTSSQWSDAQVLASQASEYREVIGNVARISEARDNLLTSFEAIPATEKDRLAKALPDNVDAVELARNLDAIASKYGIAIGSVSVDDKDSASNTAFPVEGEVGLPYDKASVSFSFVSNYENFIKFLADLEKSLRIMDVKSASFETADSGIYEHKITVQTYWLK